MNIIAPSENPHGLNSNLLFTIEENIETTPLKVDIVRADNNETIGSKLYSPAEKIDVGVTGYVAPSLEVYPISSDQPDVVFSENRAFPIKIVAQDIESQEILVTASKYEQEPNSVMNAINEYLAPIAMTDSVEIAVISDGTAIIELELIFCRKNSNDEWSRKTVASRAHKGVVVFNLQMKRISQEMIGAGLNLEEYDEIKCMISNKTTNQSIASYTAPIVKRRKNSTRICWKNRLGGVDYYTFPYMKRRLTKIDKDRVKTANGGRIVSATVEKIIEIQSDFELQKTIEQIAEIAEATKVWLCEDDKYIPIVVMDSELTIEAETATYLELKVSITQEEEFVA